MYDGMDVFLPYVQAINNAYKEGKRVRVALFGVKPIVGSIKSVSKDHFIIENEYSTSIVKYSEVRFVSVYSEDEESGDGKDA